MSTIRIGYIVVDDRSKAYQLTGQGVYQYYLVR